MALTPTQQQLLEALELCKKENKEFCDNINKGLVYTGNMEDILKKIEKNTYLIEKIREVLNSRPQALCPFRHRHPALAPSGTCNGVNYVHYDCCTQLQF
jgi:hypothetical protein